MPIINISIKNKIAQNPTKEIICGNSDYVVYFDFDEEWSEHTIKTARFAYNNVYVDVPFEGNTVAAPVISNAFTCAVGVFAGDLRTTTPAIIKCQKSIICGDGVPTKPREDVYNQIVELCNEAVTIVKSIEKRANNGEFTGGSIIGSNEVYVGNDEPKDDDTVIWIDPEGTGGDIPLGGKDGADGDTPYIKNGNWWIGETDTGVKAEGVNGTNGKDGYTPVTGTDYWTPIDKEEIVTDVITELEGIPDYWQTALEEGAKAINTALCTAGRNKSAFLFYSDAHWNYGSQMSPTLLKYLYKHTGMTKTFFGGDIVNDEATDYDTMEYLWEWRKQLKDLPHHHSVVGNHDDGNATNNLFSEQYVYGYLLSAEETEGIVRGNGMYYYIDNGSEMTRYIFLDTAYQGVDKNQQAFVKQALLSAPSGWHIVAVAHIWFDTDWTDSSHPVVGELNSGASIILSMFDNYNSRIGEYAECEGWVEFCVGGHTHLDFDGASATGIPIILVETDSKHVRSGLGFTAGTTTEAAVNGIIADYDNHKIYVVRIGRGESREVEITNYVVSYTNVLPTAIDSDGSIFNGKGFKEDTRLSASSSTGIAEQVGVCTTGYISVGAGDIVRLANITMTDANSTGRVCVVFYDGLNNTQLSAVNNTNLAKYWKGVLDDSGNLIQFTVSNTDVPTAKYMRITADVISETSIITINETIE